MAVNDDKRRRKDGTNPTLPQRAGTGLRKLDAAGARGAAAVGNYAGARLHELDKTFAPGQQAVRDLGASYSAGRPTTATRPTPAAPSAPAAPAPVRTLPVNTITGSTGSVPDAQLRRALPASPSAPARGAVVTPSAGVGGPGAAGNGAPPSPPVLRTLDRTRENPNGRPGSVASGRGAFGENVYDNASIERLQGGGQTAQSAGTFSAVAPATAAPQPRRTLAPEEPEVRYEPAQSRTLRGDLHGAEQERQQLATTLDRQIDRLSRQADTRSERALLGELVGQRAGLTGRRVDQVTGLETTGAQLGAQSAQQAQALTADAAQGRFSRRLGGNIEAARLDSAQSEGAADRAARRDLVTTRDGSFGTVDAAGNLRPVTGPDGSVAQAPQEVEQLAPKDVLSAYGRQYDAIIQSTYGQPEAMEAQLAELDSSLLGQRYLKELGGKAAPEGMTRVGTTPDGRPVYRDADGNTFTDE